jgi:hypothetical protein
MIPTGLWMELVNVCKKYNFKLYFSEDFNCRIRNCEFNYDTYVTYINELFSILKEKVLGMDASSMVESMSEEEIAAIKAEEANEPTEEELFDSLDDALATNEDE